MDNFGAVMTVLGIVGIGGVAAYAGSKYEEQNKRIGEIEELMGKSFNTISKMTPVEVQQTMVDSYIRQSVEKKVSSMAQKTLEDVRNNLNSRIFTEVSNAVSTDRERITQSVQDKLVSEVAKIDISDMKREVARKARDKIVKKFFDKYATGGDLFD